ncbi:hypothetical protein [Kineococcus sp. SYSU DK006]|uniref:hypothetical protein n=1 Tax=Kineococcus sp. SYSU DK006 TaxID=3383127 RepID=UPI003D7E210B
MQWLQRTVHGEIGTSEDCLDGNVDEAHGGVCDDAVRNHAVRNRAVRNRAVRNRAVRNQVARNHVVEDCGSPTVGARWDGQVPVTTLMTLEEERPDGGSRWVSIQPRPRRRGSRR